MHRAARFKVQRLRRKALKRDAATLLLKIQHHNKLSDEFNAHINEMVLRLQPKTGVKTEIVLTGYSKSR